MRPKILLAVLAVAGLVLGSVYLFKVPLPAPVTETSPVQKPVETNQPATKEVVLQKPVEPATNQAPQAATVTNPPPAYASEEAHESAINAEKDRLSNWAMNNDPQSLSNILADLNSPDQEIRLAAIDAAKQFEDTNAIPVLRDAATKATDPNEAIAMLKAVQWLNTPTVDFSSAGNSSQQNLTPAQTQTQAADKAKALARIQANLQNKASKQNSQGAAGSGANTGQNNNQSQPPPPQGVPPGTGQQ
jgi:hypothetical protein